MYRCNSCQWSGAQLAYIGHTRLPRIVTRDRITEITAGQGICPKCGETFKGCVHPSRLPHYTPKLNERERETLVELEAATRHADRDAARGYDVSLWVRPLDVGGGTRSHHSAILARLTEKGLAMRRQRSPLAGSRGSWEYRITPEGLALLEAV